MHNIFNNGFAYGLGRKSGKGCYVYGRNKKKTVNEEAEKLLEKYRVPINGR